MLPNTLMPSHLGISEIKSGCATCSLRSLCLPVNLNEEELKVFDNIVIQKRKIKRGEYLHQMGSRFKALFAIRSGSFKTSILDKDGRLQVTGFQMTGDLLGLDAISTESHTCDATALEDSEVCEIPFARLEEIIQAIPSLMHHFHKILSNEIVVDHNVMLLLGGKVAEERLATFLLNVSQRLSKRGYSALEFNLRMTRVDIGSYLGLRLETVSRAFSKLQEEGVITVDHKHVKINGIDQLKIRTSNISCQS